MDKQEQGLRNKVNRSENYRRLLETDGWAQLKSKLLDLYENALSGFLLETSDANVSRETMLLIMRIFDEVGDSFNSGERARNDLEKLLKRNEKNG